MGSFKQRVNLAVIKFQKKFRIWPEHFCLISGAPRSGTSAMGRWIRGHREVAGFSESRILIATHRFIEEVYRFKNLEENKEDLIYLARRITHEYYGNMRVLSRRSLILDKEPLEPIAFPDKRYSAFLENVRILLPNAKFLFMIRDPIATVFSMRQRRRWGSGLRNFELRTFSIEEHIENWCSCVDCILQYSNDPNTYICQFGRLLRDSDEESRRICNFLKIRKGNPFQPRQTKSIEFSSEECELILKRSRPQLEALYAHGLSDII